MGKFVWGLFRGSSCWKLCRGFGWEVAVWEFVGEPLSHCCWRFCGGGGTLLEGGSLFVCSGCPSSDGSIVLRCVQNIWGGGPGAGSTVWGFLF